MRRKNVMLSVSVKKLKDVSRKDVVRKNFEEREYLRETERQKELMIVEASLSQEAERESLSTSLALEQAGASSQSASEDLAEESQSTSESEVMSESAKI